MRRTWFALVKSSPETLLERVEKLKGNVGVLPIYDLVYTVHEMSRAKYKPVARKVVPVSTQDPDTPIPEYQEIQIGELADLLTVPMKMEDLRFTKWLTKDRISSIISWIPAGFLSKSEAELLVQVMMQYKEVIVFMDLERGTFNQEYYPDYVI